MSLAEFFDVTNPPVDPLREDLIAMVMDRYTNTPRHLQVELGPSETGHPCMRNLAYGTMGVPRCNPEYDPLPSILGTAAHTWMEAAGRLANERLGRERWLMEHRVTITPGLTGSCDLFDTDTGTVVDYKFPGVNRFDMYRKEMSPLFIKQGHQYGLGFENAGYEVNEIVIALIPRAGRLHGMHLWRQPYDRQIALDVVARREQVIGICDDLQVEDNPDRYQWIQATPYDCVFCPWFKPDPKTGYQCNGKA